MSLARFWFLTTLVLVSVACSAGDVEVARVGNLSISKVEILELRNTYPDDRAPASAFREDLTRIILQEVVAQALQAEYGIVVTAEEIDSETARVLGAIADSGQVLDQAFGPGATEATARRNVTAFLLRGRGLEALAGDVEFLSTLLEQDPLAFTIVCVRHILVATDAEAEAVIARLDAEEPFADIAAELSMDTATPGGDLGCRPASQYVPEFAVAAAEGPVGELVGPVESQFGFHVMIVDDRSSPTLDEMIADPSAFLSEEAISERFRQWFNDRVRAADVTIASEVGTWSAQVLGIIPPPRRVNPPTGGG